MTSGPTGTDSNGNVDDKRLQTLRVWFTEPSNDIMTYIRSKSLDDAVEEAIPLENDRPAEDDRVPDGLPRNSILYDLAVVIQEKNRVISHFVPVGLPLSNVSLVSLVPDSTVRERQMLLRHYSVHARYMEQYIRRKNEGTLNNLLRQWYNDRFNEMLIDEHRAMQN